MDDFDVSLPPCLIDITKNPIGVVQIAGLEQVDSRNQSASVLLPPAQEQRVMILGGAPARGEKNATDSVDVIDLKAGPAPTFKPAAALRLARVHANAVILPDRTVFVSGGALQREGGEAHRTTARLQSEIFDTITGEWQLGATAQIARMYHSVALLLPDGRVVAGVNLAVQAQDWSTQRIIRELKPAVLATCAEISALLSDTNAGAL